MVSSAPDRVLSDPVTHARFKNLDISRWSVYKSIRFFRPALLAVMKWTARLESPSPLADLT